MSRPQKTLEFERTRIAANDMWSIASTLHFFAKEEVKRHPRNLVAAGLVFYAFTIEAALNHLGAELFVHWDEMERLSPVGKLKVIYEKAGIPFECGRDPLQIICGLFTFRNDCAHGKTMIVSGSRRIPTTVDVDEVFRKIEPYCPTDWDKFCELSNLERARNAVNAFLAEIRESTGVDFSLNVSGVTRFSTAEEQKL